MAPGVALVLCAAAALCHWPVAIESAGSVHTPDLEPVRCCASARAAVPWSADDPLIARVLQWMGACALGARFWPLACRSRQCFDWRHEPRCRRRGRVRFLWRTGAGHWHTAAENTHSTRSNHPAWVRCCRVSLAGIVRINRCASERFTSTPLTGGGLPMQSLAWVRSEPVGSLYNCNRGILSWDWVMRPGGARSPEAA